MAEAADLLPSRRREELEVGSGVAIAHPAAASERARKPRYPSRLREGISAQPSSHPPTGSLGECQSFRIIHPVGLGVRVQMSRFPV